MVKPLATSKPCSWASFRQTTDKPLVVKSVKTVNTVNTVNTEGLLTKQTETCEVSYGPFAARPPITGLPRDRWSFVQFSTRWPPSAPNVVIWYFGGIYPKDPRVHDFIPGIAMLDGDLDCWTTAPEFTVSVTLRKRGLDAANVTPVLGVQAVENDLNSISLKFVFKKGDIDLQRRHADVNIDISNVKVSAP